MNSRPKSILLKIFLFPLTRILVGLAIFIAVPSLASKWVLKPALSEIIPDESIEQMVRWVVSIFLLIFLYIVVFTIYERRSISELSIRHAGTENTIGFFMGALLVGLIVLTLIATGSISFTVVNKFSIIFMPLIWLILMALVEEIIFRGIIYRITEQSLGTWLALIISAMLFGIGHIANAHADFLGIFSVALAGVFLGALYTFRARLWYPLAVHAGWNFFQYFFGLPISGNDDFEYFLNADREGPAWFVGGEFGIENSILAIILILGLSVIILHISGKQNRIIQPYWKR